VKSVLTSTTVLVVGCLFAFGVAFSSTLVAYYIWLPLSSDQPPDAVHQVSFTQADLDLGRVATGVRTDFAVHYHNDTTRIVHVVDIKTSCGCVTVGQFQDSVLPGDSGLIALQLSTLGIGAGNKLLKRVALSFVRADGSCFQEEFGVTAEVAPDVNVVPTCIVFKTASGVETTFQLTVNRDLASVEQFASLTIQAPQFIRVREVSRNASQAVFLWVFTRIRGLFPWSGGMLGVSQRPREERSASCPVLRYGWSLHSNHPLRAERKRGQVRFFCQPCR